MPWLPFTPPTPPTKQTTASYPPGGVAVVGPIVPSSLDGTPPSESAVPPVSLAPAAAARGARVNFATDDETQVQRRLAIRPSPSYGLVCMHNFRTFERDATIDVDRSDVITIFALQSNFNVRQSKARVDVLDGPICVDDYGIPTRARAVTATKTPRPQVALFRANLSST